MTTQAEGDFRLADKTKAYHRRDADSSARNNCARVLAIMLASLTGFTVIWLAMAAGMTGPVDQQILLMFRSAADITDPLGPAWFEEMMAEYSALGGYAILIMAVVIVGVGLALTGHRPLAIFLIASFASGSAVSSLLKHLIERSRPDLVDHLDRTFTASFPSGHAMISMLTFLTLAALVIRLCSTRALRIFVLVTAMSVAVLIGVSRIYLGVHWPSDVAAGWCLGIGWACACWLVAHYIEHNRTRQTDELGHSKI